MVGLVKEKLTGGGYCVIASCIITYIDIFVEEFCLEIPGHYSPLLANSAIKDLTGGGKYCSGLKFIR